MAKRKSFSVSIWNVFRFYLSFIAAKLLSFYFSSCCCYYCCCCCCCWYYRCCCCRCCCCWFSNHVAGFSSNTATLSPRLCLFGHTRVTRRVRAAGAASAEGEGKGHEADTVSLATNITTKLGLVKAKLQRNQLWAKWGNKDLSWKVRQKYRKSREMEQEGQRRAGGGTQCSRFVRDLQLTIYVSPLALHLPQKKIYIDFVCYFLFFYFLLCSLHFEETNAEFLLEFVCVFVCVCKREREIEREL